MSKAVRIVGLTGIKGSGKDTLALHAEPHIRRVAFGDNVKEVCKPLFDRAFVLFKREHGREPTKEEMRWVWQTMGTDLVRKRFPTFWVDWGMEQAQEILRRSPRYAVVFTDVRFQNEADAIRAAGGLIVRVTRDGKVVGDDPHPSETEMASIVPDLTLDAASGDIAALFRNARTLSALTKRIRVYLAGAVQHGADPWGWRKEFCRVADEGSRFEGIIPSDEGLEQQLHEAQARGDGRAAFDVMRRIIALDLDLVTGADAVLLRWCANTARGAGTQGEATVARLHEIPVVIWRADDTPLPLWLQGCADRIVSPGAGLVWDEVLSALDAALDAANEGES